MLGTLGIEVEVELEAIGSSASAYEILGRAGRDACPTGGERGVVEGPRARCRGLLPKGSTAADCLLAARLRRMNRENRQYANIVTVEEDAGGNSLVFEFLPVFGLLFIVREFDLPRTSFFIEKVTRVTAFKTPQVSSEDELCVRWGVEDGFLEGENGRIGDGIRREAERVERLLYSAERFEDLSRTRRNQP